MTCPFCDFADDNLIVVERHAIEVHPEWAKSMISRSALRRAIVTGALPRRGR